MNRLAVYPFKPRRKPEPSPGEEPAEVPAAAEKNISAMLRMEEAALTERSVGERFADAVMKVAVKPWFIVSHVIAYALWILVNTLGRWQFDPRPFNFLSTIIAVEAIFLTLLVLASQQRMLRLSDRRAHVTLQVDLLAEQEMTVMIRMLERLFEHFKLDAVATAPQSAELRKTTDLEALVDKVDRRMNERK
jgi:uncharacterized membrane protein